MNNKKEPKTIDEYIDTFPKDIQVTLQGIRRTIHDAAPDTEEAIAYSMPTFNFRGSHLVYFSAWKNHIGLYPITSAMEASIKELSAYVRSGKGTIQFPLDKPMPLDLITKITLYRIKEIIGDNTIT